MKYIKKVILENFQSHKYSVIEFDSQLNVIVGPSDSGKTAILRAIKWVLYNEPTGDYFIREGEVECSVKIVFSDGIKIKRYRSKSKNSYFLYDADDKETKFEAFGISVPQEVIDKTGITKMLLDSELSSTINFSDQLEGSFLLSEKGSTRASSLGRLVGVNIVDDALREALKDSRNLTSNKRNVDDNILDLENELLEYEYLDELSIKLNNLERIRNELHLKSSSLSKYKDLHEKNIYLKKEKKELYHFIENFKGMELLDNIISNIPLNINKYEYLIKQNENISKLLLHKKQNTKIVNDYKNINLAEKHINNMESIYIKQDILSKLKSKFNINTLEIKKLTELSNKLNSLNLVQDNIRVIGNSKQQLEKLKQIKNKDLILKKSLDKGNIYINQFNNIDKTSIILLELQNKLNIMNKLTNLYNLYTLNEKDIKNIRISVNEYKITIEKELVEYKDMLLKQGTCPLCFSNIDEKKANHIISHYN